MTQYERLQDLFNAQHNWSSANPRAIRLTDMAILATLETSEQRRLIRDDDGLSEQEYFGSRILSAALAHLQGDPSPFAVSTVEWWLQNCQ